MGGGGRGRGEAVALYSFGSLTQGTRTFYFRLIEPFPNLLGPIVQFTHPWENAQINTSLVGFMDTLNLKMLVSL